jgi:hypothetical protein
MMRALALAAFAVAMTLTPAGAQVGDDPDGAQTLHDYVLTMDRLKRYDAAAQAFEKAERTSAHLKADSADMIAEPQHTLADIVAKYASHRRIYQYYAKQGLSTLDAAAVPLVLSYACLVNRHPQLAARMADHVSDDQVAFCKAHQSEISALKTFGANR